MPAPVAIAVVSWNTRELLDACLTSLRADHDAGRAEVWVVDNASDDGSAAMVADRHPWARLEALDANVGYGPAVNRVAAQTSTPFVAAANSDLRVAPDAVARIVSGAERSPGAGAFVPRLVLADGSTQHTVHPFPTVATGLLLSTGLVALRPIGRRLPMEGAWDPDVERDVDWAHGAFMVVRREAWDAVGGFDERQWLYAEDLDLCWRLARVGWRTRYLPDARIDHAVSAATASRWDAAERAVRTQRSAYAWMLARRGRARTRAVALAHLAGPAVRARLYALAARAAPGRYAARRDRQRLYAAMHRTGLEPAHELEAHRRRAG
jgi:GT2 family glycosyltransferase